MNKKELLIQRSKVRNKYQIPGQTAFSKRPVNAIILRSGSFLHEAGKFIGCFQYHNFGLVSFTPEMGRLLRELEKEVLKAPLKNPTTPKRKYSFITEAQRHKKANVGVIIDHVGLDEGVEGELFEYETDPKRAARFKDQDVTVIMV